MAAIYLFFKFEKFKIIMNISELHIAFKIEADKNAVNIGMSGCPSFYLRK